MTQTQTLEKAGTQAPATREAPLRTPYYSVSGNEEGFDIKVYMPGVAKGGVDINLDNDQLTIDGTRTHKRPEGWKAIREELPQADFHLKLRLNVEIDPDKITANVEDGVLYLHLPKAEAIKPRKISVL